MLGRRLVLDEHAREAGSDGDVALGRERGQAKAHHSRLSPKNFNLVQIRAHAPWDTLAPRKSATPRYWLLGVRLRRSGRGTNATLVVWMREAEFTVGEYELVILSGEDSLGLERR